MEDSNYDWFNDYEYTPKSKNKKSKNKILNDSISDFNKKMEVSVETNLKNYKKSTNLGQSIEDIIKNRIYEILNKSKNIEMPNDIIETDNIGEVIEKLVILHCRMWYLEDAIGLATSDEEIASLKRKIDICFKQKRPKYVSAINAMIDNAIVNGKSLIEDSVKIYKGHK